MAYFDCIVGGSGKGNTLVVTCADDLAGATITCTNGTKTYTKTCPSTAPYEVTFYGLAAGTWTVSATVSGDTYTTTVVITDYEAELGGFSWRAWVDLSKNYTSSDFTDLDDLLDTELAVRELMSIHACVDYLAGIATESADVETIIGNDLCAKWINNRDYALDTLYANTIIADYMDTADKYFYGEWVITDNTTTPPTWGPKGNVPVMTSSTAPYGTASASSAISDWPAYKAFDGNLSTVWNASSASYPQNLQYKFVNPVCAKRFHMKIREDNIRVQTYKVQASNDGFVNDTHDLTETLTATYGSDGDWVELNNSDYYLYYRVLCLTGTYTVMLEEVQFYGRELSVSVPIMTNNTAPYGEAFANPAGAYDGASEVFDGVNSAAGECWFGTYEANNTYIGYKFTNPILLKSFFVENNAARTQAIKNFTLQASNDGFVSDIHDLGTFTNPAATTGLRTWFDVNTDTPYKHYRLFITSRHNTDQYVCIGSINFYGLDYSEKEFEEGTNKKWLYDHGVELETLITEATAGTVTKQSDSILMNCTSGGSTYARVRTDAIDFTPYDLLRVKVGKELVSGGQSRFGVAGVASRDSYLADVGNVAIGTQVPNNTGLDISSYNSSYYPNVYNADTGGKLTLVEWWLE